MRGQPGTDEWYALYTRHQHEKSVAEFLSYFGIETFLPLYDVVHQWKDRKKQLSLPLFPCYVFLRGGLEKRNRILSAPGVYQIVGTGGRPVAIAANEIAAIQKAVNSTLRVEPHPFLHCGDRVRVRSGALNGIEGILLRKKNTYRLIISATLLGKSMSVEVDSNCVERISTGLILPATPPKRVERFEHERATG
ncbi:MAG: transcription termination/antitermination protein NusG [Candidatus Acidiferrales bacterium]